MIDPALHGAIRRAAWYQISHISIYKFNIIWKLCNCERPGDMGKVERKPCFIAEGGVPDDHALP